MREPLDAKHRKALLRDLLRIRRVEERIVALYPEQEIRCPTHLSIGQEAVASGVCAHLTPSDYALSAHRSHAHYVSKGGDLNAMFAELYGKVTGCARGKGGSMHLIDQTVGFLGCVPIVGSTIPIGVGAAFGAALKNERRLTAIFFGDGAAETGVFHESLNFASLRRLPILFVCENNLYSVNTPMALRQPEKRSIHALASAHGIEVAEVDGQDAEQVHEVARRLVDHARSGAGPAFLECSTYRWLEHCGPNVDTHLPFRPEGEYEEWTARDPLVILRDRLRADDVISTQDLDVMEASIGEEIDAAVRFARQSAYPDRSELLAGVYPSGSR